MTQVQNRAFASRRAIEALAQPAPMLTFFALCLLLRLAYTVNDVLIGELARRHDSTEIAAFRGLSLGVTMAPLLGWVPLTAWQALGARLGEFVAMVSITAIGNLLHLQAARRLPFGLRAAVLVAGVALGGLGFGALFFDEHLSSVELLWCSLVVTSAVLCSLGDHSNEGLTADIPKGAILTLAAAVLFALGALVFARLARATNPLLVGWAWEIGSGVVLLPLLVVRRREAWEPGIWRRFVRTGIYSLPTVVGTWASAVALTLGPLGLWAAMAGTQALFSAGIGAVRHRERIGARRWFYFALGALGVAGLAFSRQSP